MANKRKRLDKQTLIVLGAVLAVETVACVGVTMTIHQRKSAQEQTLTDREAALDDVRVESATLPALQQQYARMQAQVASLEGALPPAEYIPTLLGQIEQTAIHSGVVIANFRPKGSMPGTGSTKKDDAKKGDDANKLQFDMNVTGTYAQMQRFLSNLTRFRKILALDSIKLQPQGADAVGVSPSLNGSLSFTAYILPAGTIPAAPATPAAPAPSTASAGGGARRSASASGGATRG